MRKILGITMGDPAGVGPEITVKALQDPKVYESCKPLVVGDAAILERACGFVGAKCTIHPVADPSEGLYEHGIIDILDLGLLKPEDFAIGQVSAAAGDAAFRYVRKVIELAMDGKVDINSAILLLVAVCCVYPFLYVFFVATTDGTYLARGEMTFLPMGFNLKAFGYILTNPRFNVFAGMRNSFLYTALGTLLAVACTYVTAYVLSRPRFKHRYWLMSLFIITWVFDAGIIPQYIIYNQFGFVNSPWVMIVPGAISTQFLIITKTFLEGIPNELEEAAVVDGASDIKILTRVFLPLSPTVLATTGLFYAVSIWNQYLIPQIYLKDDAIKTIQQVLKNVVITDGSSGTTFKNVVLDGVTLNQQNLKAAAIFIAMLPIICVYPFVQKYFKKGILIGSVKG